MPDVFYYFRASDEAAYMFQNFKSYLQRLITFDEQEWLTVMQGLEIKHLKKHEVLLKANTVCKHLAFVNKGAVRTHINNKGEEITFFFFFENSVAADYESFITKKPTGFAMEAIEDSEVILLSYEHVQNTYNKMREGQKLARYIAEYLYIIQRQRTFSLLLETPEERYKNMVDGKSEILQRVNQYYVATYLGIKPQSLSRIRKRLQT